MANVKVHFILDKSGSMSLVEDSTRSGFNEYVETLKKDKKNKYTMTVTTFDTEVKVLFAKNTDLKDVELTKKNYRPEGMTALYDAACQTINEVKNSKGKNIVVIMTDGAENSSREYSEKEFTKLVEELQKKKNWTLVFLGANQDSWLTAQRFGFHHGNVANFRADDKNVKSTMRAMAAATMDLSGSADMSTQAFLSVAKDDNDNIKDIED